MSGSHPSPELGPSSFTFCSMIAAVALSLISCSFRAFTDFWSDISLSFSPSDSQFCGFEWSLCFCREIQRRRRSKKTVCKPSFLSRQAYNYTIRKLGHLDLIANNCDWLLLTSLLIAYSADSSTKEFCLGLDTLFYLASTSIFYSIYNYSDY